MTIKIKKKAPKKYWVPEILYEEAGEGTLTSHIPFIDVPEEEKMPPVIFIFESRRTGETEPDQNGEEQPIREITLHQYADMQVLKNKLTAAEYDKVRGCLGLEKLETATKKGKAITEKVTQNATL